ncbi:hypothetical protein ZYGR_0A03540 [Zygosaccharomyces rouxii]|uniref:ZYRO0A08074p n=2 Tax=Zygosaccharomyces rouxii TaxID=4956 RepID=C5DQ24_ZYGRC|nr:uncharacterized protein ZYRO0A08074g [Zygosaccharomyces rouxii]KAH9198695.1 hypothetical protein LQ764DRAFT_139984 [Zygosaccharomyces rouxii]GAV46759.1 hypothetical protein ZYGR_0A03540 [Zygosaccharomyces rouxii]CAR25785.1 ZYRO0A08074p [Zygosaccharomyces rouxii]
MKFLKALGLLALASWGQALTIKDANFAFPDTDTRGIMVGPIDHETKKLNKPLTLDTLDQTVELNFASDSRLTQATLLLGLPDRGLEQAIQATLTENQGLLLYRVRIPINQLSQHLLHLAVNEKQLLAGSLVLANEDEGFLLSLFDIKLDVNETAFEYVKPERLEAKPEIHHVFNAEPQTVPWSFAQIFSFLIVLVTFGLVVSWMSAGALTWSGLPKGLNTIYFLAFVGSVIGFEFIFVRYYTGTSIFETLRCTFLLSIPSLWLGTHFLRSWGKELR